MKPVRMTHVVLPGSKPPLKELRCQCGNRVRTHSVEYFCGLCRTVLVEPVTPQSTKLDHYSYNYSSG